MVMLLPLAAGALELTLVPDPPLPVADLVHDSGFEAEGFWVGGGFWRGKGEVAVVDDQAHLGRRSLRFVGLSHDAAGRMASKEFTLCPGIPYRLDFWVRSCREIPTGGGISLHYSCEDTQIVPDWVTAQVAPLVKLPETWVRFSSPPPDIAAQTQMLFWQPRAKGGRRHYKVVSGNVVVFPEERFTGKIKSHLEVFSRGVGVLWFDDLSLRPMKTWLRYAVKGGSGRFRLTDKAGKVWAEGEFMDKIADSMLVPADNIYTLEATTMKGERKHVSCPN